MPEPTPTTREAMRSAMNALHLKCAIRTTRPIIAPSARSRSPFGERTANVGRDMFICSAAANADEVRRSAGKRIDAARKGTRATALGVSPLANHKAATTISCLQRGGDAFTY